MENNNNQNGQIESWPDLAIGLYDKLTGRNAAITYNFDDFQVDVPSKVGAQNPATQWKMNGKLTITTTDGTTAG